MVQKDRNAERGNQMTSETTTRESLEAVTEEPMSLEALQAKIADLEAKLAARPARASNSTREVCARNHDTSNWKVTPKGVRYCKSCYREMRMEQALKKARELGLIEAGAATETE